MGCCQSCTNQVEQDIDSQYQTLVVTKPDPVNIEEIDLEDSEDTDVPLFAQVSSSDDAPVEQAETLTDEELNLYAERLNQSE